MLIITDSHVSLANQNHEDFFAMLDLVAAGDEDVVFLGDIFDLWVSLPRYENHLHKRFLAWCKEEKARRMVGFIEGNHEFYMVRRHQDCFSWSDGAAHQLDGTLFVHGDLINKEDTNYLRLRKITKNPWTRTLFFLLPGGPALVQHLKRKIKKTNKEFRIGLPIPALEAYGQACLDAGHKRVLVGHFHESFRHGDERGELVVLPDWFSSGRIGRARSLADPVETLHWRDLQSN